MAKRWRYQPVIRITEINGVQDLCVSLCEVYLNEDETLDSWTEELACAPIGDDPASLSGAISCMLINAMCWMPVLADELKPGMTFKRTVDQKTREDLASFIGSAGVFLARATPEGVSRDGSA